MDNVIFAENSVHADSTYQFNGNWTIFNLGSISWKCQLGHYMKEDGHYGISAGAQRTLLHAPRLSVFA